MLFSNVESVLLKVLLVLLKVLFLLLVLLKVLLLELMLASTAITILLRRHAVQTCVIGQLVLVSKV